MPRWSAIAVRKTCDWRIERFRHWLEMRARTAPPKSASLGLPVSSRLRFDGAWFWTMWICTSILVLAFVGRRRGVLDWSGPAEVAPRPAPLHAAIRCLPPAQVGEQATPVDRDLGGGAERHHLP